MSHRYHPDSEMKHTEQARKRFQLQRMILDSLKEEVGHLYENALISLSDIATDKDLFLNSFTFKEHEITATDNYQSFPNGWAYTGQFENEYVRATFSFRVERVKYAGVSWSFNAYRRALLEEEVYFDVDRYGAPKNESYKPVFVDKCVYYEKKLSMDPRQTENAQHAQELIDAALEEVRQRILHEDWDNNAPALDMLRATKFQIDLIDLEAIEGQGY